MTVWIIILCAGVITFGMRLSFLLGRASFPHWFRSLLLYVPAAVLAALVLPELAAPARTLDLLNPRLAAGIVAALVAWRSGDALATVGAGMGALWLIQAFI